MYILILRFLKQILLTDVFLLTRLFYAWVFLLLISSCSTPNLSAGYASYNQNIAPSIYPRSENRNKGDYIPPSNLNLPVAVRNLRQWGISCDPNVDETDKVITAFHQASRGAFLLKIDCPVLLDSQTDIAKTVFVEDNTSVVMDSKGQIIVTNIFHPAFALVNTDKFYALNWKVVFKNINPTIENVGGYFINGVFVENTKGGAPAYAFNSIVLKKWYAQNRGLTFANTNPWWTGPESNSAIFFFKGSTKSITFETLKVSVPDTSRVDQFAPVVMSFNYGPVSNQKITPSSLVNASSSAIPSDLSFNRIMFDGTYMGFLGSLRNATFKNIRSYHYGDLQKIDNSDAGGVGKWFSPPHLFYLNYNVLGDPALFNENITITDVIDYGQRKGVARDKGGRDTVSGYANSLKIGGVNVMVDHYESYRPDGLMDILPSKGLTIQNVNATYDSSFLNGVFPGIRFPASGYQRVNLRNIVLEDLSPKSTTLPMTFANAPTNDYLTFLNITLKAKSFCSVKNDLMEKAGTMYSGAHNDILIRYDFKDCIHHKPTSILSGRKGSISWYSTIKPSINTVNASTLSEWVWSIRGVKTCQNTQLTGGSLPTSGRQLLSPTKARIYELSIQCVDMNGDKVTLAH